MRSDVAEVEVDEPGEWTWVGTCGTVDLYLSDTPDYVHVEFYVVAE